MTVSRRCALALAGLVVVILTPVQPALPGTLDSPGCLAGGTPAVVAGVDERLDLRLADGRTVHLPGVATGLAPAGTQQALADWLQGSAVDVAPLHDGMDRWGRVVALVFANPPGTPGRPVSVTEALLDAGWALARPDPALERCWPTLLRLERGAERAGSGLWHSSGALRPDDGAGLQARAGTFALVEGQVAVVREGRSRLYIRFAAAGRTGMAATLPRPLLKRFVAAALDPHGWVGRRLRVRGLLDDRWGWQIDVTTPQQIDLDAP